MEGWPKTIHICQNILRLSRDPFQLKDETRHWCHCTERQKVTSYRVEGWPKIICTHLSQYFTPFSWPRPIKRRNTKLSGRRSRVTGWKGDEELRSLQRDRVKISHKFPSRVHLLNCVGRGAAVKTWKSQEDNNWPKGFAAFSFYFVTCPVANTHTL